MKSNWKLSALALAFVAGGAFAQAYPAKPVTWIVPFAAGGPTDALARSIAERVARELGQPIVIDNTPGAGGTVGSGRLYEGAQGLSKLFPGAVVQQRGFYDGGVFGWESEEGFG